MTGHHLILSATDEGKLTPERYQKLPSAAVTGHHLILSATDEGKLTPERYQQLLSMRYYDGLEKGIYLPKLTSAAVTGQGELLCGISLSQT
jgi:hypothetical protein